MSNSTDKPHVKLINGVSKMVGLRLIMRVALLVIFVCSSYSFSVSKLSKPEATERVGSNSPFHKYAPIEVFLSRTSASFFMTDTDGDGVIDDDDLDDDNDGILDIDEDVSSTGFISYEFYDSAPSGFTVDNIPTTGATASGTTSQFNVGALQSLITPGDADTYSIRYSGNINITSAETITFYTTSDDGSKLFIDGSEVVSNDGLHGANTQSGSIALTAGLHSITVLFFENGGGATLSVEYESASISRTNIPFGVLSTSSDFDGDGIADRLDIDSDNDGIPDNIEAQTTAGYIAPNTDNAITYASNNGVNSAYLGGLTPIDTDGTEGNDYRDNDSDNDDIPDIEENGDPDNSTSGVDTDGDGLDDNFEGGNLNDGFDVNDEIDDPTTDLPDVNNNAAFGGEPDYRETVDTDGDGVQDTDDLDDDNDGILDTVEDMPLSGTLDYEFYNSVPSGNTVDNIPTSGATGTGAASSFNPNNLQNIWTPGDADTYSIRFFGNIQISTNETYTFYTTSDDGSKLFINGAEVVDNDGLHAPATQSGTIALTAGIYTIEVLFFENGGGSSLTVEYQSSSIARTDIPFSVLFGITDFDGDGFINSLDLDSDNDGIPDNVEAQTTAGYNAPNADIVPTYISNNGVNSAYTGGLTPVNTDGADEEDYLDSDSENDGVGDIQENGDPDITASGVDSDGDGLDDNFEGGDVNDGFDVNDEIDNPVSDLPDENGDAGAGGDVDYRDIVDTDRDGLTDDVDLDDDNDGILDSDETGTPNSIFYEFYDAAPSGNTVDNIPTSGAIATGVISDFDVDALYAAITPSDGNTFAIRYSGTISISAADTYTFYTTSDDGSRLSINGATVVDNDGLHGAVTQSGTIDLSIGSYPIEVLFFENTGGEVLSVQYSSPSITQTNLPFSILSTPTDFDGDGLEDRVDIDSDDDGIPDNVEAQSTAGYIAPNADNAATYLANSGVNSAYLGGLSVVNTDGTDSPDYLDTDSDNDGMLDIEENGYTDNTTSGIDSDLDGLDNNFEGADSNDGFDVNDEIDNPSADLPDSDGDIGSGGDVDYRDDLINDTGPGGVFEDIQLWLRANTGTNTATNGAGVTSWTDQTLSTHDASGTGSATYLSLFANFNPGLSFTNDAQPISGNIERTNGTGSTIFVVGQIPSVANNALVEFGTASNRAYMFDDNYAASSVAHYSLQTNTPSIWAVTDPGGTTDASIYEDGSLIYTQPKTQNTNWTSGGSFFIGDDRTGNDRLIGEIAEVIYYDQELSASDRQKVETYLAMKYGITLDNSAGGDAGDYIASNDDILWDASENSVYNTDVIAIGRDDDSEFLQKQSQSIDDSTSLYINALSINNNTNIGTYDGDGQFLIMGHNGRELCSDGTIDEIPGGTSSKIEREWAVTNSSFDGTFGINITLGACANLGSVDTDDLRLLVDTDGDFRNSTVFSSSDGIVFSNSSGIISIRGITTAQIPTGTTRYITLASGSFNTPLPIELIDFKAEVVNNSFIELSWQTATEINNDYFTIERSMDASNWEILGFVSGSGNSNVVLSYSSLDGNPFTGLSYYRLKQTDFDGYYSYSDVVLVNVIPSNQVRIYPNHTQGLVTLRGSSLKKEEIKVLDPQGKDITKSIFLETIEKGVILLDFKDAFSGIYLVRAGQSTHKVYLN
ncbi:MAG: PA14 domain-containing protein [Bacteroidota bacterium]